MLVIGKKNLTVGIITPKLKMTFKNESTSIDSSSPPAVH